MSEEFDNAQITRSEHLGLLKSLGVTLPPHTKLPTDALAKRLRAALNAAQDLRTLVPSPPLDPSRLPHWDKAQHKGDVFSAINRGSFREAFAKEEAMKSGKSAFDAYPELYADPFMDLRQTFLTIAKNWDLGQNVMLMQDPDCQHCAINIRIISIHYLAERTPLVILLYFAATKKNFSQAFPWVNRHVTSGRHIRNITATPLEQKLFLKLLSDNSKLLSDKFAVTRTNDESHFTLSFFLPVGPLSGEDLGRLNADPGCAVCGKKTSSRCSQCQAISYCGAECQRQDWKNHKSTCRALKGGTWRTLTMTHLPIIMQSNIPGAVMSLFNMNSRPSNRADFERAMKNVSASEPPVVQPNVHGQKLFMIKIQVPVGDHSEMLVYDRQRSFQMYYPREERETLYDEVVREVKRNGVGGLKMYRWARRVGDWKLDVCIDRVPEGDVNW